MKKVILYLIFSVVLLNCVSYDTRVKNNRIEILGEDFLNEDIEHIDVVHLKHPMFGGILGAYNLDSNEKIFFIGL